MSSHRYFLDQTCGCGKQLCVFWPFAILRFGVSLATGDGHLSVSTAGWNFRVDPCLMLLQVSSAEEEKKALMATQLEVILSELVAVQAAKDKASADNMVLQKTLISTRQELKDQAATHDARLQKQVHLQFLQEGHTWFAPLSLNNLLQGY
jgi:hypothetical protein